LTALVFPQVWPVMKIMREFRQYPSKAEAKTALARNPDDAMAHDTLAKAAGDRKTRLAEMKTAYQLDPTNEWYKMDLSVALHVSGRGAEAIPLLKSITNPRLRPEAQTLLQQISQTPVKPAPPSAPVPR
jgi:hypothetical protein